MREREREHFGDILTSIYLSCCRSGGVSGSTPVQQSIQEINMNCHVVLEKVSLTRPLVLLKSPAHVFRELDRMELVVSKVRANH